MNKDIAIQQVRKVIERLSKDGSVVANSNGTTHRVFPVGVSTGEGEALLKWVSREGSTQTIEIGLGYGISALFICMGLLMIGDQTARHVVLDPNQAGRFANCGLQNLEEAGVKQLVEYHAQESQIALPQFLNEDRSYDLGFIDGNHRFDAVFLDLFYLGRLVRKGGIIILDDYNLPGIKRAVSFFVTNLDWTIEDMDTLNDKHHWVVLRTAKDTDKRDYRYFVDF